MEYPLYHKIIIQIHSQDAKFNRRGICFGNFILLSDNLYTPTKNNG